MSEEDRRELIASQHRALYGANSNMYSPDPSARPPMLSDLRGPGSNPPGLRGSSPYDAFGLGPTSVGAPAVEPIGPREPKDGPVQSRSREGSTSSPASNNPTSASYMTFDATTQASTRTTTSSPGNADSPSTTGRANVKPAPTSAAGGAGAVAPIGTRPNNGPASATSPASSSQPPGLQKPRATTPLTSPLGFGFSSGDSTQAQGGAGADKSGNSPPHGDDNKNGSSNLRGGSGPWGNGGGSVWGGKGGLGVQAKVWG
jgi:hypothetical protein